MALRLPTLASTHVGRAICTARPGSRASERTRLEGASVSFVLASGCGCVVRNRECGGARSGARKLQEFCTPAVLVAAARGLRQINYVLPTVPLPQIRIAAQQLSVSGDGGGPARRLR